VPALCDNLVHVYAKEAVLSNFYLKVDKGEIYGLLGHNGCGKTTALSIIAGKILPTHGRVLVFGEEPRNMLMKIGYCPQEGLLIGELTVEQNIRLAGALRGLRADYVSKYMLRLIIYFRLRNVLQVQARHLSAAQKKKASLVVALLGFPKLLLFDEVTGGVDPEGRRRILNLIKSYSSELGGTVLMVSHDIAEAEDICGRISILKDGILRKAGTPNCLRAEMQHEFSLLTLNFARGLHETVLERQKAKVKEYVYGLVFVKLEL
jgi:ABC-2 type transport system ATP-binding protein